MAKQRSANIRTEIGKHNISEIIRFSYKSALPISFIAGNNLVTVTSKESSSTVCAEWIFSLRMSGLQVTIVRIAKLLFYVMFYRDNACDLSSHFILIYIVVNFGFAAPKLRISVLMQNPKSNYKNAHVPCGD